MKATTPTLHLTRGIMASGKSTFAKAWVQEDPQRRVRVNRDDLRKMLSGTNDTLLPWAQEQQVTAAERAIALSALEKGKDVIVDSMNLRAKYVRPWMELGYPVEFHDFPVSLSDAVTRNAGRPNPIPFEAVQRAYDRYTDGGALPEPPSVDKPKVEKYEADWSLPQALICDIDGTLAHIVPGGRSPYDYTRVSEDVVDPYVAHLVNLYAETHHVILMSGREDSCREETENWLRDNSIQHDELYMRATGDGRKDANVKLELFDAHVRHRFNVMGVADDRNQVVRMWRELGLKCFQAQEGAF